MAQMKMDFKSLDLTQYQSRWHNGRLLRKVDAEFQIHFGTRRGVLEFSCVAGGKQIDNATVSFDGQDGAGASSGVGHGSSCAPSCATQYIAGAWWQISTWPRYPSCEAQHQKTSTSFIQTYHGGRIRRYREGHVFRTAQSCSCIDRIAWVS